MLLEIICGDVKFLPVGRELTAQMIEAREEEKGRGGQIRLYHHIRIASTFYVKGQLYIKDVIE